MNKISGKSWNLNIYIVTWNISTKFPDQISVNGLLGLDTVGNDDRYLPDLYIVGLQEINSQPQNVVISLFKNDPWTTKFRDILSAKDYIEIKIEQMQGLLLIFYAKRKHLLHLRNIEAEYTRTGMGGFWGNKGAISIRFNLYGCGITFVNAHLAAHDHQLDERIEDFKQILDNHHYHVPQYREIFDHEYVFWFGDLNFRLTGENITAQDIRNLINKNRLDDLFERDQLSLIRKEKRAFHQLDERVPCFPPTFKFERGTNEYDMKRRPAWTDRILYKVRTDKFRGINLSGEQMSYKSHPEYNISDHKPVTSEFTIKVCSDWIDNMIEFSNIPIWHIGEENIIEYNVPADYEEKDSDWIGVFPSNYCSLGDYIAYEYTNRSNDSDVNKRSPKPIRQLHNQVLEQHQASHQRHQDRQQQQQSRRNIHKSIHLEFSESIDLDEDAYYVLLYFQSTGIRGVTSVIGVSNVFRAEKRPASPRFEAVD